MKINYPKLKEQLIETCIIVAVCTVIFICFDHTHWKGVDEEQDKKIGDKILSRFYFTTTTISSVGYGDISPKSNACRIVVSILQLFIVIHIIGIIGNY